MRFAKEIDKHVLSFPALQMHSCVIQMSSSTTKKNIKWLCNLFPFSEVYDLFPDIGKYQIGSGLLINATIIYRFEAIFKCNGPKIYSFEASKAGCSFVYRTHRYTIRRKNEISDSCCIIVNLNSDSFAVSVFFLLLFFIIFFFVFQFDVDVNLLFGTKQENNWNRTSCTNLCLKCDIYTYFPLDLNPRAKLSCSFFVVEKLLMPFFFSFSKV